MIKKWYLQIILCMTATNALSIKIDRVILAVDDNPMYTQFWPDVARWWQEIIGIEKVTLAFVAHKDVHIDDSIGEIIRIEPIPGVPTSLHAQAIRLLLPAYYPDEVCILSDVDLVPLSRDFLVDYVKHIPQDNFVVYHLYPEKPIYKDRFPMCYVAARGSVFQEIFNLTDVNDIPSKIKDWSQRGIGFTTDEKVLYEYVTSWQKFDSHCSRCNVIPFYLRRIKREQGYDPDLAAQGYYIDSHCPRTQHPDTNKAWINELIRLVLNPH